MVAAGRTRSISVSRLLGSRGDVLNAALAWLGDEVPAEAGCAARRSSVCLIIVHADPSGGPLTARTIVLPGVSGAPFAIGTDAADPHSLLLAGGQGDRAIIDQVSVAGAAGSVRRLVSIPAALVDAFDPTSRRLLYISGYNPPGLWSATIGDGASRTSTG